MCWGVFYVSYQRLQKEVKGVDAVLFCKFISQTNLFSRVNGSYEGNLNHTMCWD